MPHSNMRQIDFSTPLMMDAHISNDLRPYQTRIARQRKSGCKASRKARFTTQQNNYIFKTNKLHHNTPSHITNNPDPRYRPTAARA
jgi:hypothetical protein